MSLTLMYITNNIEVAKIAQDAGVDRIWIDMEYIGKEARQGGMDTVKSRHTIEDIKKIRPYVTKSEILVRVNPIHDKSNDYCSSEEEIDMAINAGADVIMLPMFKDKTDVARFLAAVNGRVKTNLLFETAEAVENADDILSLPGIDEVHIGLNDLHLSKGKKFMFELICDGTVKKLCEKFREKGVKYGFGGIARVGYGMLPAEYIITEHYAMGSSAVILSRGFCDANKVSDPESIRNIFIDGVKNIRKKEEEVSQYTKEGYAENRKIIADKVQRIVEKIDESKPVLNKKICFITTISLTMKSFVVETAKYLHNKCGADVTLICSADEDFAAALPEYIRFIPVDMPRGARLSGFRSIKQLRRIFREERFDLVQYSTPNASCYASIAAKKERVPIRLYCQWGIRYVGLSGISGKIFKYLERVVCRNSTGIHAVSPLNMKFAVDEKLYTENKVRVVGNGGTIGVNMDEYDISTKDERNIAIRSSLGIKTDDFVFGFAGRISADKGCDELLSAFREISEINKNVKLLAVGPFEDDCGVAPKLIEWAKKSDSVILTGQIDNAEMKNYYSAMDCLVHPTYREGFGMIIQEAGALAVPVITTKIPGASEVMVDGESCMLVEPKNIKQLKNAMLSLLCDSELTQKLGMSAYERTKELYARPVMLENQKAAYEELFQK